MAVAKRRAFWFGAAIVVALVAAVGLVLEDRLWRAQPQPDWISRKPDGKFGPTQFEYLSIGGERDVSLPYWVFYVLPSMFPEKLPLKKSGYGSFGLSWEQGLELPIGLTKVTIGYPRVGFNCALCHVAQREQPGGQSKFAPTRSGNSTAIAALSRFFYECAKDPRFDGDDVLSEISNFKKLDWIDWLLYRFYIIPKVRDQILDGGQNFLWAPHGDPTTGTGDQGHGYANSLPEDERRALIEFAKTL
jgi:hypothetical protein